MTGPAPQFESTRSPAPAWLEAVGLLAISALALYLRTLATAAPFTSADHIMIAYRTTCEPGWRWCFQNHYGPLQPLITKLFALAVTGLGIPMTETLWRLPMGMVGAVIPILAFILARQLNRVALSSGLMLGSDEQEMTAARVIRTANKRPLTVPPKTAAWYAAMWTAVLPPLVTDARYMWAYETLGTALALAVVIATFAYMDRPTRGRAWTVGLLLALYLQSHLHVFAVPCVIVLILLWDRHSEDEDPSRSPCLSAAADSGTRSPSARVLRAMRTPGLWLPPVISMCVLIAAWRIFGGGPIARIITKTSGAAESPDRIAVALNLARAWLGHVGWLVAALIVAMLALSSARRLVVRPATRCKISRRAWFLMIWIIIFAAPLFIFGFRTGRPTQYLTQATTVAMVLTAVVLFADPRSRNGPIVLRSVVGMLITCVLCLGSLIANVISRTPSQWLGITAAWGANVPNAGYKTAGWYVRERVPADAVLFALHDTSGLERPVAEYYLGRACIAAEDLTPDQSLALFRGLADKVDVIVDDLRVDPGRARDWPAEFFHAARIHNGGTDLIHIFARGSMPQEMMQLEPSVTDSKFDIEFGPRTLGAAPPKPPRFPESSTIRNLIRK